MSGAVFVLDLLQHRRLDALGEVVAGDDQGGNAIDRRGGSSGHHVRGARSDRRQAGEGLSPVLHLGEGHRRMDHGLLVSCEVVRELVLVLLDGLRHATDVAVTEYPPDAGEERVLVAVVLDALGDQEADERLAGGQSNCCHVRPFECDQQVGRSMTRTHVRAVDGHDAGVVGITCGLGFNTHDACCATLRILVALSAIDDHTCVIESDVRTTVDVSMSGVVMCVTCRA